MVRPGEAQNRKLALFIGAGWLIALGFFLLRFVDIDATLLLGAISVAPAAFLVASLAGAAVLGRKTFAAVVAVCLLVAVVAAAGPAASPNTSCGIPADIALDRIAVMSHNVHSETSDPSAVASQIMEVSPDVVLLQEAGAEFLAEVRDVLGDAYPYAESVGFQTTLSRLPLSNTWHTGTATGGSLVTTVDARVANVTVANVHASAPVLAERRVNQRQELQEMLDWREERDVDLLMGDFNASSAQPVFRDLITDGYVDAHSEEGCGFGLTWSPAGAGPGILSLDHALVAGEFNVGSFVVLDYASSDHRAIAVWFPL